MVGIRQQSIKSIIDCCMVALRLPNSTESWFFMKYRVGFVVWTRLLRADRRSTGQLTINNDRNSIHFSVEISYIFIKTQKVLAALLVLQMEFIASNILYLLLYVFSTCILIISSTSQLASTKQKTKNWLYLETNCIAS